MQDFCLNDRLAVITGGAKGIGRAIAEKFVVAGACVVIADHDEDAAIQTASELNAIRPDAVSHVALDVTCRDAVEHAATAIEQRYGTPHILVNNAGIVKNTKAEDTSLEDWRRVMDVNLDGVFFCAQSFGRLMIKAGRGSIVNMSSMCGEIVVQPQPQIAYNVSKAGVNLLTKSLAVEWAPHKIRVNAVAPGYTATELTLAGRSQPEWFNHWLKMTPMGRLGQPAEIANAVLFLASDAASFITGNILTVDGGYTAL